MPELSAVRPPACCLVCGREFEPAQRGDTSSVQLPWSGVEFRASGNYGSRVFDSVLPYEYLVVNICDVCLVVRRKRVLLVRVREVREEYRVEPWEPRSPTT